MNSSDFELRLASRLRELADLNVTPIDPLATAERVVYRRRTVRLGWPVFRHSSFGRLLWIAALLGLLIVGLFALAYVGSRNNAKLLTATPSASTPAAVILQSPTVSPNPFAPVERLAAIRHGELFLGTTDGKLTPTGSRAAIDSASPSQPSSRRSQSGALVAGWNPPGRRDRTDDPATRSGMDSCLPTILVADRGCLMGPISRGLRTASTW